MGKKTIHPSTEQSLSGFIDQLGKRSFDQAFRDVYNFARKSGDERLIPEFVRAYRSFMADLVERHVDMILEQGRAGLDAYKRAQFNRIDAESRNKRPLETDNQQAPGLTAVKPSVTNPNGVIVRRSK